MTATALTYAEVSPAELLGSGFTAPLVNDSPWLVRWDLLDAGLDLDAFVMDSLAPTVDLGTSGTTGASQIWRRTREQMWSEAGLLAGLIERDRPRALLSFAPPRHVYGALASVLVPARLRLPAWYRPQYFGAMPPVEAGRWAIVAVPWTFSILGRHASWVQEAEHLTVLHSTATLPAAAGSVAVAAGVGRMRIVEVFGSTEAGGIASRTWNSDLPPWELFDDVEFAMPGEPSEGEEIPLVVRSPRLAFPPGGAPQEIWRTDDYVRPLGGRRFQFDGRRDRLVKINGRRVDLDEVEESVKAVLPCADLAFLPVSDLLSGENLDLLVVPSPREPLSVAEVRAVVGRLDVRPRQIHLVERIDRTDTGKLRRLQRPSPSDAGADS